MTISLPQGRRRGRTYHIQLCDIHNDYYGYFHYNVVSNRDDIEGANCEHVCLIKIQRESSGTRFEILYNGDSMFFHGMKNVWEAVEELEQHWEQYARDAD